MLRSSVVMFWIILVPRIELYGSNPIPRLRVATLSAKLVPKVESCHLGCLIGFMNELRSLL